MAEVLLGISAFYHDSAAALLIDGELVAAAQEERFSRLKHDPDFPRQAIQACLNTASIHPGEIDRVVFYEKPLLTFERLLETYHALAPSGLSSFWAAMPRWVKEKLFLKSILKKELKALGIQPQGLWFPEHHLSHAASAFYPSPFEEAAILTVDGVGEWSTLSICKGSGSHIQLLREQHFPHSLGLLYSAATFYLGFRVNNGEYKVMGLAAYGADDSEEVRRFRQLIRQHLVDVREDGSFLLNLKMFRFATGRQMTHDGRWKQVFGFPRRKPEQELQPIHQNFALAMQQETEAILLRLAKTAKELTQCKQLVMAGGVALNSVANGQILRSGLFEELWIQPAAGDAGGAIGAAYAGWHLGLGKARASGQDQMKAAALGPSWFSPEIEKTLRQKQANYEWIAQEALLLAKTAQAIAAGKVIGWYQGRMEFGPRALGHRSILADPRNPQMQHILNARIKFREGFRPFAPVLLEETAHRYVELDRPSPYMQLVVPLTEYGKQHLPAITHANGSARVQTVNETQHPRLYRLLKAVEQLTGHGVLINTSFNVRGEPIVTSPEDAYRCFMQTDIDMLVMDQFWVEKG